MMVDIVIVNWNSGDLLKKCVESILASDSIDSVSQILIVDNHSKDHSISLLPEHKSIKLMLNKSNLGFAKACNQGFLKSRADYVLLLNPDTLLFKETLRGCVDYMEANPNTGIMGCQLLDEAGNITSSCARFPRAIDFVVHGTGLSRFFPGVFRPATLMTDWNHEQSKMVDQVMGAFMFMRSNVFEQIGYFDERYFVYFEELDFSLRYKKAGGNIYYNTQVKAVHSGMGTTSQVKAFRLFLNLRSRLKYARKHFSFFGFVAVYLSTFTIELVSRFFLLVISGRFSEIKDLLRGYGMLFIRKNT
jgi:N-acetylglucosaminyl-diphospho-decaprenol L-rhamnosyltransferase